MERSKKVKLIQADLMRVGVRHGTGKNIDNIEAFMWALALTLLTYTAGSQSNNIKKGYTTAVSILEALKKQLKRERI